MKIPPPPPQLNILYQSGNASTPVSTPKPSISSPDQSTTAQTPPNIHSFAVNTPSSSSELAQPQTQPQPQVHPTQISVDPNTETLLVDKSDDAWALILSQRLNNSQSFTTYTPALANGYLICRYGTSDTDWMASLMVNLIYTQTRIPHNILLKDLLSIYRDMASLTRTRGVAYSRRNHAIPWHISTAVTGQELLGCIL